MSTWLTPSTTNPSFFPQVGTQVTITGSGGGSGAVVYAITTSGVVTGFNIVSGGSGYSGTITVTITGSGSAATATATQSGGAINSVTVGAGGTNYTNGAVAWHLNIAGNAWDTLLGYCGNWPSAVNGNQQSLSNLLSLGIIPVADTDSCTLYPPVLVSAGTQNGARLTLRANSFDTSNHLRDFVWRPATTTNAGNGVLSLLTRLDGSALTDILDIDQTGKISRSSSGWTNLTLLNGWTSSGGANATPGYMIDPFGIVHLRGVMAPGTLTNGTPLFTLPSGFRPVFEAQIPALAYNGGSGVAAVSLLAFDTAGNVAYFFNTGASYISLDGISFATF